MKFYLPLLLILTGAQIASAQLTLTRYSDTTYICNDEYYPRENSLVYIGPDFVTIIGATWCPESAEALHDAVVKVTDKPITEVIDTNYHPDRAGGNPYWKSIGCEIHATEMTFHLMESDWDAICDFVRKSNPGFPQIPLVLPTSVHQGSFTLQKGKIEVLYLGPSHTEDGVFVFLPEEKLLYGGCIIKPFLGNLEQANLSEYPRTLQKLKDLDLDIDKVIAGHGRSVHDKGLIDHYLKLLDEHIKDGEMAQQAHQLSTPDKNSIMKTIPETIIEMERQALERWGNGDPGGFLEISAEDVVYFDPYADKRIDGREALSERYQALWGKVNIDRFELINPKVQLCGETAVLTFNYVSYKDEQQSAWNCTEVYRRKDSGWEIIQTHWSYTCHPAICNPPK